MHARLLNLLSKTPASFSRLYLDPNRIAHNLPIAAMTSYLSKLSPVPAFNEYTGPHKVGTIDVELPVSELESPSPAPDNTISTVQYRIFYPCEADARGKSVNWIPAPQREYIAAYSRFLGAGSALAEFISFFPRLLFYVTIPARKNAPLLQPTTLNNRWPIMIFSHGLGGSRNAYSHLVGNIASHGVIVIAPEHRDGSTPISYIRDVPSTTSTSEKQDSKEGKRKIDYLSIAHTPSPEVEAARNDQLKIRLWELGLIHDSVIKLDLGQHLTNLNTSSTSLSPFANKMDVHTPGKMIFAGHSFGGATVTQFIKSIYYAPRTSTAPSSYTPLFTPSSRSSITAQITPQTPAILLDVWCFPLRAGSTRWLWDLPFPCYQSGGPGGSALLAVESQAFYKWTEHFRATKRLLSPNPASSSPSTKDYNGGKISQPHFYYASQSVHLSQSDFGVLFPWVTKKVFAVEEPERVMRLNVRAVLQLLRERGIPVSKTSKVDMELEEGKDVETDDDKAIFVRRKVRGWNWLSTALDGDGDVQEQEEGEVKSMKSTDPSEAVVGNEVLKDRRGGAVEGL